MTQIVARIDDALVDEVDRLVAVGVFASRSDAIRRGLAVMIDHLRRGEIDRRIVEEYSCAHQSDAEIASAHAAAVRMIADEPW